ncbi:MAG: addiction module protein [Gemmataceae bacterium]|nr:addiction module protein [Gemmataceae bacterium]
MTLTAEQITAAALAMSEEDRQDLLVQLMDSLDGPPDVDYEQAWAEEIKRRLDDYRAGTAETVPAAEVRRKLMEGIHDEAG